MQERLRAALPEFVPADELGEWMNTEGVGQDELSPFAPRKDWLAAREKLAVLQRAAFSFRGAKGDNAAISLREMETRLKAETVAGGLIQNVPIFVLTGA